MGCGTSFVVRGIYEFISRFICPILVSYMYAVYLLYNVLEFLTWIFSSDTFAELYSDSGSVV